MNSLDETRHQLGSAPRRIGFFGWRDKIFGIPENLRGMKPAEEPLLDTLQRQKEVWRAGRIVWGCVIVANPALRQPGAHDLPGEVLYSLTLEDEEAFERLPEIADALREAKFSDKETHDFPEEAREIVGHLRDERDRAFGMRIPAFFAGGSACHTSTFWGHRRHLPCGVLSGRMLPLLVLEGKVHDVLVIPQKFWPESLRVSWELEAGERRMRRKISEKRIEATRSREMEEPPKPWLEAEAGDVEGEWMSESEVMARQDEDGYVFSQWLRTEWSFDEEQRCRLRVRGTMLVNGEAHEDAPAFEADYEGDFEIENGVLTCVLPEHEDSPLRLVAVRAGELVNEQGERFFRVTPKTEVVDVTEGGSRVFRHQPRAPGWTPPEVSGSSLQAIEEHIEQHVGKIETVWHELVSDIVHIDIHVVAPSAERPWITLVTSGMSDLPMSTPEGAETHAHAELMLCLPANWKLGREHFDDERNYWPVRWLKTLARLPHEYNTWLSLWHTVPYGDPPQPLASGCQFTGFMLAPPMTTSVEFHELSVPPATTIHFHAVIPLTADEMDFKLKAGAAELMRRLERAKVTELVDPCRRSVLG